MYRYVNVNIVFAKKQAKCFHWFSLNYLLGKSKHWYDFETSQQSSDKLFSCVAVQKVTPDADYEPQTKVAIMCG